MCFLIVLEAGSLKSRCDTPFILASLNFQWLLAFLALWPCHSNLQATIFKSVPALSSPGFFYMCQISLYLPCIHGIALQIHSENLGKSPQIKVLNLITPAKTFFFFHIRYIFRFLGLVCDYVGSHRSTYQSNS